MHLFLINAAAYYSNARFSAEDARRAIDELVTTIEVINYC